MRFIRRAVVLTIVAVATALLVAAFSGPMLATATATPSPSPSLIGGTAPPLPTPFEYGPTPIGNDWCIPNCGV